MSFGYGVGDFLVVGQLCWRVYKRCKESPGNYAQLSTEVGALYNVLKETEELLSQQGLTAAQQARLATCRQGCEEVLKDLNGILEKYQSLGTKSQRTFDRLGLGTQDMSGIRLRLNLNVSMLDAFNNASSHARLENKLNLLMAEIRAGQRGGSVVSTQSLDTITRNDRETWEALRRELKDIGISPGIITEKREFILAWFREAVATGKLGEADSSDGSESTISSYESDDSAETSGLVDNNKNIVDGKKSFERLEPSISKGNRAQRPMPKVRQSTALHIAAHDGKEEAVRLLLCNRADVHAINSTSKTALHLAAIEGHTQIISLLLEGGAPIESKDQSGFTALHTAVFYGCLEVVQLLLEKGAQIESKDQSGYIALHYAVINGYPEVVQLLLEKGAQIESKDSDGYNALLHIAADRGRSEVVQLLLENGAQIESKDQSGSTALHYAAINGHLESIRLLLEKRAQIESKNSYDLTALHYAAGNGYPEVVQLLLEKGAQIESKDSKGFTALHRAARNKQSKVIQLLFERGAKVGTRDRSWIRALSYADSSPSSSGTTFWNFEGQA